VFSAVVEQCKISKIIFETVIFSLDIFNFLSPLTSPSKDHRTFLKIAAGLLVYFTLKAQKSNTLQIFICLVSVNSYLRKIILNQICKNFKKMEDLPQISRRQNGDIKGVLY